MWHVLVAYFPQCLLLNLRKGYIIWNIGDPPSRAPFPGSDVTLADQSTAQSATKWTGRQQGAPREVRRAPIGGQRSRGSRTSGVRRRQAVRWSHLRSPGLCGQEADSHLGFWACADQSMCTTNATFRQFVFTIPL